MRSHRFDSGRTGVRIAAGAALCALSAAAWAAASSGLPKQAVLDLPEYIGVLDYMGQRTRTDVRPGRSYSYRAAGLALDIDVLDYSPARLPDGTASPLVERGLARMERPLLAHGARLVRSGTVGLGAPADRPIGALEAVLVRRDAALRGTSYLWITARDGRLYEMHFNVRKGFEEDGEVSRSESLAALGRAIAHPRVRTRVPPRDRVDIAIHWDPATPPAESRLWAAYLYTRAAYVAAQSGQSVLPLGEHTASFDEEVRGRLMAVYLYRQIRRANRAFRSAYFADLSRVQAAGFLREYVWRYLKGPAWPRPDGLKLAAFDAWRAIHLRRHVARTYGRIDIVPLERDTVAAR